MDKVYMIRLKENDLGQVLDGLMVREESWRKTAEYLRDGYTSESDFVIEECNGENEAEQIAQSYSRIIRDIEKQRDEQRA